MKIKTNLPLMVLFILTSTTINGQIPDKWFIKNGYFITGHDGSSYTRTNVSGSTSKFFDINGVRHPALIDLSTPNIKYGNDLFIIFDNGSYYNSRYLDTQPFYAGGDPTKYGYNIAFVPDGNPYPKFSNIKYIYFTDKYEEDDPPSNSIKFSFPVSGNNNPNSLSEVIISEYNQFDLSKTQLDLSANHDIVKGKEITIIVPLIQCTNPILTYDGNLLDFDKIFLDNSLVTPQGSGINKSINLPVVTYGYQPYKFVNFKCKDPIPSTYTLETLIDFKLFCNNLEIPRSNLQEKLSSSHDPNFIKVQCIYRKRQHWFFPYKYYVLYHIECYNDGPGNESSVKLNFTLPNIVKPNISIANWKYSEISGCGKRSTAYPKNPLMSTSTDNPKTKTISFSHLFPEYELNGQYPGSTVIQQEQIAWVEICAELNVNTWAEVHAADLYISAPTTTFGSTTYPIMKFIDPKIKVDSVLYHRPISKTCNCSCPLNIASSSSSHSQN
ncbi:MAG: hypothetical protein IT265_05610 [Saprospiraceae bacterium]|nr:hypothetical protein [Saprospiraceae bacterium]